MNAREAAMVLGVAATFDRRTVGEADAQAWAAALPELRWEDARDAIVAHYRETREWVMPADVLRRVRRVRSERLVGITPPVPPAALAETPAREHEWVRRVRRGIADGLSERAAAEHACRAMGLPDPGDAPLALAPPPGIRAALTRMTEQMGAEK